MGRLRPKVQQTFIASNRSPREVVDRATRLLGVVRTRGRATEFDVFSEAHLEWLLDSLPGLEAERPRDVREFESGYVHGDFTPLNTLFRDEEVVAILDWERSGIRPLLWEVVRGVLIWFQRPDGGIDMSRAAAFVGGYADRLPLEPAQLRDALDQLWWDRLTNLWVFERHYDDGDHQADALAVKNRDLLSWWTPRREELSCGLSSAACGATAARAA